MKQQNSLIESFHEMWNAFPGMARLINSKHEILASNQNAQEKGYIPAGFPFRKAGNILTDEKDRRFWRRIIGLFIHIFFDRRVSISKEPLQVCVNPSPIL